MADRRAELVVDIRVGDITVSGGPVRIPARLDVEGGGGAGGAAAGGGAGGGLYPRAPFPTRPPGTGWRRTPTGWERPPAPPPTGVAAILPPGLAAAGAQLAVWAAAAAAAIAAAVAVVIVAIKAYERLFRIISAGLKLIWTVGKAALTALLGLVRMVAGAFIYLGKTAIGMTINAMRALTREAVKAGQAVGRLAVGFVSRAISTFADYQQTLQNTLTVMDVYGKAADKMRGDLTTALMGITAASRRSMTEAASAAYDVASAGFATLKEVTDLTRGAIVLSEATLHDLKDTARVLMATLLQFRLGTGDTMRAANAMTAVINKTPADMEKLSGALRYAGTMASMFGESLEGTLANIGGLFLVGRAATQAGMEIANVYNSLVKVSKRGIDVLSGIGISPQQINPAYNRLVDIVRVFEDAQRKFGQARVAEVITSVFTLRAARGLMGLLAIGSERVRALERDITGTNTALKMQQEQLKTLAAMWDQIKNLWQTVMIRFGLGLNPKLTKGVGLVKEFLNELLKSKIAESFGASVGKAAAAVAQIVTQLAPAGMAALQSILGLLPGLVGMVGNALLALVPTVEAALPALVSFGSQLATSLLPALISLAVTVAPVLLQVAQAVLPVLARAFADLAIAVGSFVTENRDLIVDWFTMVVGLVRDFLKALPGLAPLVEKLARAFIKALPDIMTLATDALPKLVDAAIELVDPLIDLVKDALPLAVNLFNQVLPVAIQLALVVFPAAAGALRAIADIIQTVLPVAIDIAAKAIDYLRLLFNSLGWSSDDVAKKIYDVLAWIDAHFYDIIMWACNALSVFVGALRIILVIAPMLVAGLAGVNTVLGLLMLLGAAITAVWWGFVAALNAALEAWYKWIDRKREPTDPKVLEHAKQIAAARLMQETAQSTATALAVTGAALIAAPAIATTASAAGLLALTALDRQIAVANEAAKQAKVSPRGMAPVPPPGIPTRPAPGIPTRPTPGMYPPLTPAGYTPAPAGYNVPGTYSIGPFYVNNADQMKAIFDQEYARMKADEQNRDRLRAIPAH